MFCIIFSVSVCGGLFGQQKHFEGRSVWVAPSDISSPDKIALLVRNIKRTNIKLAFVCVKDIRGRIIWHSKKRFAERVLPAFRQFDGLRLFCEESHKAGIKVYAWFHAFTEEAGSPVVRDHPEWAQLNPRGGVTTEEHLADGRSYRIVWMCPARRPGYTDQWLIPMIVDLLKNYPVDGLLLDNLCYPGYVAPDSYCFCDWCTKQIFWYAHMYYENYSKRRFAPKKPLLPKPAANWWKDFTMKPDQKTWENSPNTVKAEFLLKGSTLWEKLNIKKAANPHDMDFFFYIYRCDTLTRFVHEVWRKVAKIRPEVRLSAAVHKNPILAARFLAQKWTEWMPFTDIILPKLHRSYFPRAPFSEYLKMVEEYTKKERFWTENLCHTYIAISVVDLYEEERKPVEEMASLLGVREKKDEMLRQLEGSELVGFVRKIRGVYAKFGGRLRRFDVQTATEFEETLSKLEKAGSEGGKTVELFKKLRSITRVLLETPPQGFYPPRKLRDVVEAVRRGGGQGVSLFSAAHLTAFKLWDTLAELFKTPTEMPDEVMPLRVPSVQTLRLLSQREHELALTAKENSQLREKSVVAEKEIKRLTSQTKKLNNLVARLKTELKKLREEMERRREEAEEAVRKAEEKASGEKSERERVEKLVAELRKDLAQKEKFIRTLESRLKSARDEVEMLRERSRRALREIQDYHQKVVDTERRLEQQRYYERLRLVIAFGVAALAFAIALIATTLRRRTT